jgi:hypothetical protein
MKIKDIFPFQTLKISFPIGKTILYALLIFPLLIAAMEGLLRIIPVPESVLVPSFNKEINYPEMDIKLLRLAELENKKKINCLFLGSSMVDFGLDPSIFNRESSFAGMQNPVCFNMALRAMRPETTAEITSILIKRTNPSLIILGVSPIDFVDTETMTREFSLSSWFRFQKGIYSIEGWLIEHSETYKYWLAFLKYRNPAYRGQLENQLLLIDRYGLEETDIKKKIFQVEPNLQLPEFQVSQRDINGLLDIINDDSSTLKVIVVEMPVHPDFLAYYIPGGEEGYENQFIQPVKTVLDEKGIPFIRTQDHISEVVTPNGWKDQIHLNKLGAEQFSQWLVNELANY